MPPTPAPLWRGELPSPATLVAAYQEVRSVTEKLTAPLATEDYVIQAMPDASPPKWHLGHVSWFFESFLLEPHLPGYTRQNPLYKYLFNSYYNSVGPQYTRANRGILSRPTVAEVYDYRRRIDEAMLALVETSDLRKLEEIAPFIILGMHHEQQHQELILTDTKFNLGVNPLHPVYHERQIPRAESAPDMHWEHFSGGVAEIGRDAPGFAFDNEWPRHKTYLEPYALASRPVTAGEFMEFMEDNGYGRADLWLSEGWKTVQREQWTAPLYWEKADGRWWTQTLSGFIPVDENGPVVHVSYYEADAYARWRGMRLPTEQEWEHAAEPLPIQGNFLESGLYHPLPASGTAEGLEQMLGDTWEWTKSPYAPYPGYAPWAGAVGEYNGKFMVNQMVLRGGSCVTPQPHMRVTYRNFFPPDARWQFSGIRLARDTA